VNKKFRLLYCTHALANHQKRYKDKSNIHIEKCSRRNGGAMVPKGFRGTFGLGVGNLVRCEIKKVKK
jgi:hypothetical protein